MIISAKFASKCGVCGGWIEPGEQIAWTKGVRVVMHAGCSVEGREAAKAAQASRAVDADVELACPEGLAYMPFQRAGIAFALARRGVLFGDEMGLGKTVQLIGWINNEPEIDSALIVCPKSLVINWTRELRRWLCRDLSVGTHPAQNTKILVLSYEDAKKYKEQIAHSWGLVALDEAQYVKNSRSQRSKCCRELMALGNRRATLTGTPIPNRPIELWPLLQMTDPQGWDPEGKGFWRFASRYAGAVKDKFGWDMSGATNLPELQQQLRSTCMVRRLKKDVLTELPAKRRQVVELPATGATGAIRAEREAWDRVEARLEEARVRVELARASDDPEEFASAVKSLNKATVVAFEEIAKQRHATAVAKIPHVLEHARLALEDDADAKIIIFAHHHDVIDSIRSGLSEFGVVGIDGRNSAEERQAAVDRFQKDVSIRVFVGGIHAAGVGLTLTASAHVLFAELDWVPGNMCQAEDRAHRIGQAESVLVQLLVLEGSIDARMAAVLVEKMAIADQGLDAEIKREPAIPTSGVPATMGSVAELQKVAAGLSAADVASVHAALRSLATRCDGAMSIDGQGFSKIDTAIGRSLAASRSLSPKQAALGMRLCRKYRRQLGDGCWSV